MICQPSLFILSFELDKMTGPISLQISRDTSSSKNTIHRGILGGGPAVKVNWMDYDGDDFCDVF